MATYRLAMEYIGNFPTWKLINGPIPTYAISIGMNTSRSVSNWSLTTRSSTSARYILSVFFYRFFFSFFGWRVELWITTRPWWQLTRLRELEWYNNSKFKHSCWSPLISILLRRQCIHGRMKCPRHWLLYISVDWLSFNFQLFINYSSRFSIFSMLNSLFCSILNLIHC